MRKNPVVQLEGAKELDAALKAVGGRATGLLLSSAAEAGAKVIADEATLRAPRDSGDLAASIDIRAGRVQQGRAQYDIGIGRKAWYGMLLEFGTKFIAARPFLRPAFDTKAEEATNKVGELLRNALRDVLN